MPIVELHENPYTGEVDVYRYDYLPRALRVQVFLLIQRYEHWELPSESLHVEDINEYIVDTFSNEYGVFHLEELDIYSDDESEKYSNSLVIWPRSRLDVRYHRGELKSFFLCNKKIKHDLNAIKLAFDFMRKYAHAHKEQTIASREVLLAIEELNTRFKQHGIGYEFSNNSFLRIDSRFTHGEIVMPALNLLTDPDYSRAQEEFVAAHGYHLDGDATAALNECHKSLESTLKIICGKRKWRYKSNGGAGDLIDTVIREELIPKHWKTLFPALNNLLAGVSKARNKLSGHGQGNQESVSIPPHVITYAMHMTAAAILFLVEAEKNTNDDLPRSSPDATSVSS